MTSYLFCSYESKGKQWVKSQPAYPIGMNPALMVPADQKKKSKDGGKPTIPGLPPAAAAKKKKKTKAAKAAETPAVKEVTGKLAGFTIEEPTFTPAAATAPVSVGAPSTGKAPEDAKDSSSGSSDPAKRLKNVKKKLASIEALEAKLKSGELKNPDKDQLEKIKRKSEVIKEIKELEKLVK